MADIIDISVIICTKDRPMEMGRCLESLLIQTVKKFELIIVDASRDEQTKNVLKSKLSFLADKDWYKYIKGPAWLTRQRNIGVKEATGDIIVFLDDDTVLEKNYLQMHLETYEQDNSGQVMGCSGVLLRDKPYSKLVQFFRKIFFMNRPDNKSRVLPSGFCAMCAFDFIVSDIKEVELCGGGNTSYRKEVFRDFSFDEYLKGYGFMEDMDFSYRVSRKFKLIVNPKIRLYHYISPMSRDSIRKKIIMSIFYHWYFVRKNLPHRFYIGLLFFWSEIGTAFYDFVSQGLKVFLYHIEGLLYLITGKKIEDIIF